MDEQNLAPFCPEVGSGPQGHIPPLKPAEINLALTSEDLREFQEIWRRAFKEELTLGQARSHASKLIELYAMLARIKG